MSDYNSTATSTIYVNGKPAEAELQKLKQRASDLKDAIAAAAKAGDKADLRKLRGELTSTKREVKNVENAIHSCEVVMKRLDEATPKELNMALKQLKRELNDMERGTAAWDKQVAKIKRVKAELDSVNAEMKEHQGVLSRLNDGFNKWGMSIASAAAALTGITMTVRQAVEAYAQMDQEMANVQKFTGMSREGVEALNEEFKKIDTRTSREGLNQLAQEAGRLGKSSQEDVLGFVRAADKINVALDDLGEGATLTLSKLTGVFGTEAVYGTEQSLLKVGSVINELSQNSAASAPYLAEFASRLGGVGSQAGMTVQQIMAYGAVLDANQQQLESSATALSQLIVKLYRDPAKYAEAAGLDVQKFTDLLKKDANEAVLTLLDTLKKAGGMDALAPMFADMGEKGSRSVATLSMLASKIDDVRAQQDAANVAFEEGTSINREFDVQNNTVAAGLDKAKNGFHEMAVELGEKLAPAAKYAITGTSALMKVLSGTITFIYNYKATMAALAATIATATIALNAHTIAVKAKAAWTVISNTYDKVATALTSAKTIATQALQIAYLRLTGNLRQAAIAQNVLNNSMKASPWGAVATLIGVVVTAVIGFTEATKDATEANADLKQMNEDLASIREEHAEKLDLETRKIETLVEVARDDYASVEDRKNAIESLNRIIPNYCGKLDAETGKYYENKRALDAYLVSLREKIRLEGERAEYERLVKEEARIDREIDEVTRYDKARYRGAKGDPEVAHAAGVTLDYKGDISGIPKSSKVNQLEGQRGIVRARMKNIEDRVGKGKLVGATKEPKDPTAANSSGGGGGGGGSKKKSKGSKSSGGGKRGGRRRGGGGSKRHATTKKTGSRRSGSTGSTKKDDKFATEKQWLKEQQDEARLLYELGVYTEDEYNAVVADLQQQSFDKQLAHTNLTEAEKNEISANKWESFNKEEDRVRQKSIHDEDNSYREAVGNLTQEYIDGKISIEKLNEESEKLELQHLERMVDLTKEGSDERLAAEEAYRNKKLEITNRKNEEEKQLQKDFEDAWKESQKELEDLRHEYFGLSDDEKQKAYDNAISTLDYIYQSELKKLGDNNKAKLELERKYAKAKKKIHDGIFKEEQDAGDQQMRNWEQWVEKWLDKIFGQGTWEEYGGFVKSAWSSLMSGYQSFTKLVEAEEKEKLAAMTKKYDAELKAAEGNQYRINQINKKKAAEEKRIKDAANKRAMAMEIAQAIASNALGAINAYASASKAPWPLGMVLGPLAAGLALSAGLIQIAAIKKQHDAQSAGYAEGGFTKPGAKHEPAGIVHAGEWVASQRLLANPVARPMIDALDYAQRTNTIGRLRAGGMAGSPVVVTESDELRATIARLNKRLDEPFVTVNTVTGDNGIKKAMDDYNKLQNNTLPKNKRT